jgi:hypothetical protein
MFAVYHGRRAEVSGHDDAPFQRKKRECPKCDDVGVFVALAQRVADEPHFGLGIRFEHGRQVDISAVMQTT